MLKVQLLGHGQASYAGQPLPGFPGRRCHELLCYLLLNRQQPHPRERLAAVFWSEYPTSTSLTCLRNTLWRLRQALTDAGAPADDYVRVDDGCLSFPNSGRYWLDVEAFEQTLGGCHDFTGDKLSPDQARHLEDALELYSGDLLKEIYKDWCLYDRERLRLLHLETLAKLLVYHEHAGTFERGLDYGRQILDRDPTREQVHRQMMRLHWLLGSPCGALAQYKRCVQVLREELGIPPTGKTTLLFEQMLHNGFDPAENPVHRQDRLPEKLGQEASVQVTVEQALEQVRQLRDVSERTSARLGQLEQLIQDVALEVRHGQAS